MIIEYEGTDITSDVSMRQCVWEACEEGRLPRLRIRFDDGRGLWDSWAPRTGDRLLVSAEGAAPTGAMYVRSCEPVAGAYELQADPLPIPDAPAVRTWRSATVRAIVEQLAGALGLACAFHGYTDMLVSYARQDGEGALAVIARMCMVSGCVFDICDGVLHVCGRDWVESQPAAGTLMLTHASRYAYRSKRAYTSCRIAQTEIEGVRAGFSEIYGLSGHELSVELDSRVGFSGTRELKRACSGILACANARLSCGHMISGNLSRFTPGSACSVECDSSPSISGTGIVTRVRNDFIRGASKIWWRRI